MRQLEGDMGLPARRCRQGRCCAHGNPVRVIHGAIEVHLAHQRLTNLRGDDIGQLSVDPARIFIDGQEVVAEGGIRVVQRGT